MIGAVVRGCYQSRDKIRIGGRLLGDKSQSCEDKTHHEQAVEHGVLDTRVAGKAPETKKGIEGRALKTALFVFSICALD